MSGRRTGATVATLHRSGLGSHQERTRILRRIHRSRLVEGTREVFLLKVLLRRTWAMDIRLGMDGRQP